MRKLYNHNKGKIHPSPPPSTTTDYLSLLPFTIAVLAATLPPDDKEVLAYLLSCSLTTTTTNNNVNNNRKISNKIGGGGGSHSPKFNCNCFSCYTSYWVRWDASLNRQRIHEIIDSYEDGLIYNKKNKKDRKKNKISPHAPPTVTEVVSHAPPQVEANTTDTSDDVDDDKGSVRKFVNFVGGRIWGVWGI
ncbi:uncharacterized protein [Rutidosis leptorrhynchoides]|uniref:uncharacterized protein n=1 Tax=Rutidosis leptorrhynchoides TaxID=125765 RepID=UPI003A9905D8